MIQEKPPSPLPSDAPLVEMLRVGGGSNINDLQQALGVTATAVRQRLERLMRAGIVARSSQTHGRGRPSHVYALTETGRRIGGDNFRDLALVLWQELRSVGDATVRRGLIARIGASLAKNCRDRVSGQTPRERLEQAATLMRERQISCTVTEGVDELPVLTTYTCPYPELAEQDRGICAAERLMLQELAGATVQLADCRLDGADCCRFAVTGAEPMTGPEGGA
jgi:predicted ArsR family transcriptional regulator